MAYPTTTEHSKLYPYTSIMGSPYSCDSTGVIDCTASIESIKANQSNVGTIFIPKGTFSIATNLTTPVGMMLRFEIGAKFTIAIGVTLTINGPLEAGLYQIFSCTGTGKVVFGETSNTVRMVFAAWFGAVPDGTSDNFAAITQAVSSISGGSYGGIVQLGIGNHAVSDTVQVSNKIILRGVGRNATKIMALAGFTPTTTYFSGTDNVKPVVQLGTPGGADAIGTLLEDLSVDCNNIAGLTGVFSDNVQENGGIKRCAISYSDYGIYFRSETPGSYHPMHETLEDLEIYAGGASGVNSVGILLQHSAMAFLNRISTNNNVYGSSQIAAGILACGSVQIVAQNLHHENCVAGVLLGDAVRGAALTTIINGVSGGTLADVTTVVKKVSGYPFTITGISRGGATNAYDDGTTTITQDYVPLIIVSGPSYYITSSLKMEQKANLNFTTGTWEGSFIQFGNNRIFKDAKNQMRIMNGLPTSDASGNEISLQLTGTVQTTDATSTELINKALPVNTSCLVIADVSARKSDGSKVSGWKLMAVSHRTTGNVTTVGSATIFSHETDAATNVVIGASGTSVRILVYGIAAETWDWHVKMRLVPHDGSLIQ